MTESDPFKTPTQDLIVVKHAKGVYDAVRVSLISSFSTDTLQRLAPMFQQAQPVIQDVINRTAEINSAIGARAHATLQTSQEISHALLDQLRVLADHGSQIPANMLDVSAFFESPCEIMPKIPAHVSQAVGKATNDVKGIVFEKDASIQDKSNKLGAYVVVSERDPSL